MGMDLDLTVLPLNAYLMVKFTYRYINGNCRTNIADRMVM